MIKRTLENSAGNKPGGNGRIQLLAKDENLAREFFRSLRSSGSSKSVPARKRMKFKHRLLTVKKMKYLATVSEM